jgi:spore germination protein YaaH
VESRSFEEPVYTNISKDYDINLVWHQVTEAAANAKLLTVLADTKGINTISPTWFSLSDNDGNITSLADATYVEHAHQLGIEVWALIDNFKEDVSTHEVLSYTSKRERLTNQLIAAAIEYNLDGINIDFEELKTEEAEHFIEFIRELSIKCRNNGIVLSIDNYVPTEYSALYNRKEQGIVADYVIIMGYDEHYSTSETPGSVASIDFVRSGIENTLLEVPKEKVINGIPFYTRLWIETPKSEETIASENENTEYVPYTLDSQIYSMANADKLMTINGITPVWDDTTKQYYANYEVDGIGYEIWLDEETSIEEKMKLIDENELAGVACWKLGLEKQSIWDTIIKYVN